MPRGSEVVVLPWVVKLSFPCKALPRGAGRGLRIDVNWEKVTLISQYPGEASIPVHTAPPPLLHVGLHGEQTGDRF